MNCYCNDVTSVKCNGSGDFCVGADPARDAHLKIVDTIIIERNRYFIWNDFRLEQYHCKIIIVILVFFFFFLCFLIFSENTRKLITNRASSLNGYWQPNQLFLTNSDFQLHLSKTVILHHIYDRLLYQTDAFHFCVPFLSGVEELPFHFQVL
ncbi:hypothetical protein CW304_33055 [Bacillus sp. UFRGS-B20]|nr:hypothetical protein CW304_33055 [Bacillus sp. UFRGS-B20]